MAGHNKWAQIKHKKAATDAKKSKLWSVLSRRISVESKRANGDVTSPPLRTWIEKARDANMPKENIERAVSKGTTADAATLESITYEAYGPGGVAIIIETLTDNRNRTTQGIKHILSKNSLMLASVGSAAWAFTKTNDGYEPQTIVPIPENDEPALMLLLEQLHDHDDVEEVYTNAGE